MATSSPPTRIDGELYQFAQAVAPTMSRSTAQQVSHWARIGRELEAADSVSQRDIAEVLAGKRPYDGLDAREQAAVRAEWAERMDVRRESLDLTARFDAEARPYASLDADGNVVIYGADAGETATGG